MHSHHMQTNMQEKQVSKTCTHSAHTGQPRTKQRFVFGSEASTLATIDGIRCEINLAVLQHVHLHNQRMIQADIVQKLASCKQIFPARDS